MTKEEKITLVLITILAVCSITFIGLFVYLRSGATRTRIIVDWNSPKFIGERSGHYTAIFAKTKLDEEVDDDVKKEFTDIKDDFAEAHSNAELIRLYGISFKENTLSDLAIECNTKLFDMCNKYYLVTYGGQQVSPLIPMAISNIETPGRADHKVTYCSLFPSKLIEITAADQMENMSCIVVMESPELFAALASDHWTRDRGSLQMNLTYGTEYESYNSLMGPSEAEILSNVQNMGIDLKYYAAYEARNNRNISGEEWLKQISSAPGDRYNIRDSLLRLAAASQAHVDQYASQYEINSDYEMMCLIGMSHNAGSVWNPEYVSSKIGNWRSGSIAHRYCTQISSQEFVRKIKKLCTSRLEEARNTGADIPMTLDRAVARQLFEEGVNEGLVSDYRTYVYEGNYYEVTFCYTIQVLYNYIMLGLVYSGY